MAARLPILEWLPSYDPRGLKGDIAAGVAVTALIVPKDLGYAGIAGVPLQNGLYAAAAGALFYALFCTSRQISTGPSSSLAAVAGGAVLATGLNEGQAAQLDVAIGELPKLTGTDSEGKNAWRELGSWVGSLDSTHAATLLVGLTSLAVILGLRWV